MPCALAPSGPPSQSLAGLHQAAALYGSFLDSLSGVVPAVLPAQNFLPPGCYLLSSATCIPQSAPPQGRGNPVCFQQVKFLQGWQRKRFGRSASIRSDSRLSNRIDPPACSAARLVGGRSALTRVFPQSNQRLPCSVRPALPGQSDVWHAECSTIPPRTSIRPGYCRACNGALVFQSEKAQRAFPALLLRSAWYIIYKVTALEH